MNSIESKTCLSLEYSNFKTNIELLKHNIMICEKEKEKILKIKFYWFQKRKKQRYYAFINKIDEKINYYFKEIEKELSIINR